ncbi:MAG: hypothetical protein MUE44_03540 [Oscillatoriaceae cyanobacterium Prado104]|jgi:uncharacterized protein YdcH (DUF465 family)|nr:hypothetical protein [Oscillatoriaceae cyanobacterium Prado104]
MGRSNTIDEQAKVNAEFQKYIDEQTANLDRMALEAKTQIAATIDSYYREAKCTDAAPLIQGSYQHLATASEWSLDSLSKMIDSLKNSIFGAPAPEGTTATPQSSELAKNVAHLSEMNLLIMGAAFNAIQGIMAGFSASTQTGVKKDFATKQLAPGLTLFLCVIDNQYFRASFTRNDTILQTAYIFDTRFSIQQAGSIAKFNQVQALIAAQGASQAILAKFDDAVSKLDPADDNFDAKYARYNTSMNQINAQIKTLQEQIDALSKKQMEALKQKRVEALRQKQLANKAFDSFDKKSSSETPASLSFKFGVNSCGTLMKEVEISTTVNLSQDNSKPRILGEAVNARSVLIRDGESQDIDLRDSRAMTITAKGGTATVYLDKKVGDTFWSAVKTTAVIRTSDGFALRNNPFKVKDRTTDVINKFEDLDSEQIRVTVKNADITVGY